MNKEIYEDLFKNVVINGHYSFEKLNEMKSYIKTLNIKIDNLEQQVKKQKEVIKKIMYKIENYTTLNEPRIRKELLDILKEVE